MLPASLDRASAVTWLAWGEGFTVTIVWAARREVANRAVVTTPHRGYPWAQRP
jgi:hypothetical protein